MNKEYTIGLRRKLLMFIVSVAILATGVYLYASAAPADKTLHAVVAMLLCLLAVYLLCYYIRKKVTITQTHIIFQGALTRTELLKSDIGGYKIDKDNLIFVARPPGKMLYISRCNALVNYAELLEFAANFKNIDAKHYQNEFDTMLHDEAIGSTPKERKQKIQAAKKLCTVINYAGIGVAIYEFVSVDVFRYALIAGLVFPLLVICLFYAKRNLLTFNSYTGEGSAYPNLTNALIAPVLGMLLKAIKGWHILSYTVIIWPAVAIAIVLLMLFIFILNDANIKTRSNQVSLAHIVFFIFLYSTIATININCEFDNSDALVYKTTVIDKRYTTGKNAAQYITIDKCGPLQQPTEITIGKSFYEAVHLNETIRLHAKPGLLHIPWFYVSQ
ncbi:hypothetical protein [Mucilaginibacter ginsenosidivorax]|uniref:Uncharacterized protein n=1 Tax=Mucilaginibacter ginsenosidivorax TaxID=862126 RepID=A0A5B8W4B8_9SPHI|nr:hypothetical protein [Mucilaginibacter ginsenosidivorax]QEC78247.1 hypothetical protein FSB76_20730 [Mucilaginibacter ginsenosidivorax]